MIDVIIILAYLAVAFHFLWRAFKWLQTRFNIYGQNQSPIQQIKKSETLSRPIQEVGKLTELISQKTQIINQSSEKSEIPTNVANNAQENVKSQQHPEQNKTQEKSQQQKHQVCAQQKKLEEIIKQAQGFIMKQTQSFEISQKLKQKEQNNAQDSNQITDGHSSEQERLNIEQISNQTNGVAQKSSEQQNIDNQLLRQKREAERQKLINEMKKLMQEIRKAKDSIKNKNQQISSLNSQNIFLAGQNQQLTKANDESKSEVSNLSQKLESNLEQQNSFKQKIWQLNQEKEKLIQQMESEKQIKNQQIQQLKKNLQRTSQSIKVQNAQEPLSENSNADHNSNSDTKIVQLSTKIQQLKNQLEFCQNQLQSALQSQTKLKQELHQLVETSNSRLKGRGQVSITDVINHPEYLRIKQKLLKYESGNPTGSRPRSIVRGQFTPQGDRLSKATDSRISQRRSFIPSRLTDGGDRQQHSEEIFGDCSFLNQQGKHFVLDQIKKIKKLAIKKTKLIFKLDKLHPTNPHELIDNIPNIILLIQLTNKKVLAAFTQIAFSKEDGIHAEKSSVARSRFGANKALILDITNKVSLANIHPNQTIIYDQNAIVWGKDQLVIKNDQPTLLYSSFSTQQGGVYWDGKYSLEELLGGDQGFQRINQYQFHRIYIS